MVNRVFLSVLIFIAIIYMPFWLSAALALVGLIYFPFYWESVLLLLISDILHGTKMEAFFGFTFVTTILGLILLYGSEYLKKKLKFYPEHN